MSSTAPKPALRLDWCTHAAAKYAVETWHYSKRMPMPPLVRVGVWEGGKFIGCVLFGRGANASLGSPYGLNQTQCAELVRVAMTTHVVPVTRVVALAIKFLAKHSPGLRLVVSFADPSRGHHGGIYQGGELDVRRHVVARMGVSARRTVEALARDAWRCVRQRLGRC